MEWRESGIVISMRKHGESAAIIELFTEERGRHLGVVRGGASRRNIPTLQTGNQVDAEWKARLEAHMGAFKVELEHSRAALFLDDRLALSALSGICGLLSFALPEREPHPRLYRRTKNLLDALGSDLDWSHAYVWWEITLLEELGFALDLSSCAATGQTEDLIYVSPKSGRAVSRKGAGEWADRMLPLPPVLRGEEGTRTELIDGLLTTGYFLDHAVAPAFGNKPLPDARGRLVALLKRDIR
jgi:DNA repair protein RecO (recombination protein O)